MHAVVVTASTIKSIIHGQSWPPQYNGVRQTYIGTYGANMWNGQLPMVTVVCYATMVFVDGIETSELGMAKRPPSECTSARVLCVVNDTRDSRS
jgi:hypothetical protein